MYYSVVVLNSLKTAVLRDVHEGVLGGHLGVDKSLGKLKERFYWPSHYNDVKRWCATCVSCATRKPGGPTRRGPLQPIIVGYPLQLSVVFYISNEFMLPVYDDSTVESKIFKRI